MTCLLILMALLTALTAGTLRAALADARAVRQAKINGLTSYIVRNDVRSEALRLTKHLIAFSGICAITQTGMDHLTAWGINPMTYRNGVIITIAALLGLNSMLDLWSRHHSRHAPRALHKDK